MIISNIKIYVLLIIVLIAGLVLPVSAATRMKPEILVLESYHPTQLWTESVNNGLLNVFKTSEDYDDSIFYFEYLDTERNPGGNHLKVMAVTLSHKYSRRTRPFDLVIAIGDNALDFLFNHGKELFPHAPVIFCSAGNFSQKLRSQRPVTGLSERVFPLKTVTEALKILPDTHNLLVISDNKTTRSRMFRLQAAKELASMDQRLNIEYLPVMTLAEVKKKLSKLPPSTIILLLSYNIDKNNRTISSIDFIKLIRESCKAPIFSVSKSHLGHGILGGMLKDGYIEGMEVGRLGMKVLDGEKPNLIPVKGTHSNQIAFDADLIKEFNISKSKIPDTAVIINQQKSFLIRNREWIIVVLAVFLIQSLILGALLVNRRNFMKSKIELAEVNENFTLFMSQLPASVIICTRHGHVLLANGAAKKLFDLKKGIDGLTLEHLCTEAFITEFHRLRGRSMFDGEADFTYSGAIRSNPDIVIRGSIFPLFRNDSNPIFGCIFSDVTQRLRDEIEIEERSRRIQLATDAAGLEFWDWIISDNKLCPVENPQGNQQANKIINACIENWTEIVHHADRAMVQDAIKRCLENQNQTFNSEFRFKDIDDKWQWVSAVGIISERNEKKRPVRMAGCFRVITDAKNSEEMLKRTQFAVDSAPEEIYYLDSDGDFVYVNDYICRKAGLTREVLLTKNIRDVNPFFKDPENWKKHWNKIYKQKLLVMETTHVGQDGSEYPVEADFYMVKSSNEELVCICARDVTVQKRYEAELVKARDLAEESNRLKSAFLANISHEIRTPLNSIVGFSQLLSNQDIKEEDRNRYLDLINGGSRQLMTMIGDILDLSRIESGELEVFPVPTKVNELIEEVFEHFDLRLKNDNKTNMELLFDTVDSDLMALADPDRLKQILTSLLDNAFKFTEKGHVKVGANLNNGRVILYVEDTGCGISQDMSGNIFKQFRQGSTSFTNKYRGIGIGLALCQELVEKMHGSIDFKSIVDKGTTFFVELPAAVENTIVKEDRDSSIPSWTGKTILIVDDNVDVRIFLQALLSVTSSKLLLASSGQEAIDLCRQHEEIGAVLMDLNMPKLSGIDTTAAIKKFRPKLPIIAQTAYYAPTEGRTLLDQGFDGFLTKPIEREQLFSQLSYFLGEK